MWNGKIEEYKFKEKNMFKLIREINDAIKDYYEKNGQVSSKKEIIDLIEEKFGIFKVKRSLYADSKNAFIFRFLWSKFDYGTPSNTYLGINTIAMYDEYPIIAILVRPSSFDMSLGNTTFVDKVSHSSKGMVLDENGDYSLSGSVNYNNLILENNTYDTLEYNWNVHSNSDFYENIKRIGERTTSISGHTVEKIILDSDALSEFVQKTTKLHKDTFDEVSTLIHFAFHSKKDEIERLFNDEPSTKVRGEKIQSLITGIEENDHEFADMYYEIRGRSFLFNIKTIDLTLPSSNSSPQAFNIDKLMNNVDYDDEFAFYFFIIFKKPDGVDYALINFLETQAIRSYGNPMTHWSGIGTRGHMQIDGVSQLLDSLPGNGREVPNEIDEDLAFEFMKYLNDL